MPKPSAGCKECKRRKIKVSLLLNSILDEITNVQQCDERQGFMGCSNCLKRGLECSGATTQVDSIIRDETAKTASKFVVVPSSPIEPHGREIAVSPEPGPSNLRPPPSPSPADDFDELALEMFYSTYCLRDVPRKSVQDFKQVGNGSLFAAVKALGLESIPQRSDFQVTRLYNQAIGFLNTALASPFTGKSNSTLLATIILSTIEMKASPQLSLDDYFSHIQGASALLHLRGPEQVLTKLGAALYMQMSAQVYLSCLFGQQGLPGGFRQLREQVAVFAKQPPLPCWREHGALMWFVDFKHTAERLLQQGELNLEDGTNLVIEALDIYDDLSSIFENAPPIWQFESITSNAQPWMQQEHVYKCFIAAQSWTTFRLTTVILFNIIINALQICAEQDELLSQLTEDRKLYVRNANHIVREAALAIISSAPQQVSFMSLRLAKPDEVQKNPIPLAPESFEKTQYFHCEAFVRDQIVEDEDLPFVLFPAGINIYQATYLAAKIDTVDADVKQRLISALGSIAVQTGIKQAHALSGMLTTSGTSTYP